MEDSLVSRLDACERANRRLARVLLLQAAFLALVLVALLTSVARSQAARASSPQSLRLRELIIVDPAGVERVRISGDIGDEAKRGQKAAGVFLYDGGGRERGGYVTWEPSGNVGLTLDTRQAQATLFVVAPDSGSALQLWHGDDVIELRSDEDGSRLTAARAQRVVVQEPEITTMSRETCAAYRELGSRISPEQLLQECQRRFTEAACGACLAGR